MSQKSIVVGIVLIVAVGAAALHAYKARQRTPILDRTNQATSFQPHSFEECIKAGNPVLESSPRQCTVGKYTFIEPQQEDHSGSGTEVVLSTIHAQDLVQSPLVVSGKAPGNWFFEANIGLRLLDADGKEVARGHATAEKDWMTTGLVPFSGSIVFSVPATATGYIEIEKDNPSDKPELDGSVRVPVRFR
jgi:uncharacterized membrane protein YgdD (TMEM256/DUF423 family)